ncbi:MAG: DUF4440 domain-containing protein [Acidimicrobiia bacterium]
MQHEDLIDLERQFWERSGDRAFWEENFADEGLVVLGPGTMDKTDVIRAQASAEPWDEYGLEDLETIELGDDVVCLVYRARARRAGDENPYRAMIGSVYALSDRWKLVMHQQTPI